MPKWKAMPEKAAGHSRDDCVIKVTPQFAFFWGGWPSQWLRSSFEVAGITYNCAEQYMMAEKARLFGDEEIRVKIMAASNPREQKALGRKVRNFDATIWESQCRDIVYRGNLAKFEQNKDLRQKLLGTGDRRMVEASPRDRIWGIGMASSNPMATDPSKWRGTNWLGEALDRVRATLRSKESKGSESAKES